MASYIGKHPPTQSGIVNRFRYTASGSQTAFTGAEITLVIGIITDVDILLIPLITYKSDFEKKTKRKESVTMEIIVKFFI